MNIILASLIISGTFQKAIPLQESFYVGDPLTQGYSSDWSGPGRGLATGTHLYWATQSGIKVWNGTQWGQFAPRLDTSINREWVEMAVSRTKLYRTKNGNQIYSCSFTNVPVSSLPVCTSGWKLEKTLTSGTFSKLVAVKGKENVFASVVGGAEGVFDVGMAGVPLPSGGQWDVHDLAIDPETNDLFAAGIEAKGAAVKRYNSTLGVWAALSTEGLPATIQTLRLSVGASGRVFLLVGTGTTGAVWTLEQGTWVKYDNKGWGINTLMAYIAAHPTIPGLVFVASQKPNVNNSITHFTRCTLNGSLRECEQQAYPGNSKRSIGVDNSGTKYWGDRLISSTDQGLFEIFPVEPPVLISKDVEATVAKSAGVFKEQSLVFAGVDGSIQAYRPGQGFVQKFGNGDGARVITGTDPDETQWALTICQGSTPLKPQYLRKIVRNPLTSGADKEWHHLGGCDPEYHKDCGWVDNLMVNTLPYNTQNMNEFDADPLNSKFIVGAYKELKTETTTGLNVQVHVTCDGEFKPGNTPVATLKVLTESSAPVAVRMPTGFLFKDANGKCKAAPEKSAWIVTLDKIYRLFSNPGNPDVFSIQPYRHVRETDALGMQLAQDPENSGNLFFIMPSNAPSAKTNGRIYKQMIDGTKITFRMVSPEGVVHPHVPQSLAMNFNPSEGRYRFYIGSHDGVYTADIDAGSLGGDLPVTKLAGLPTDVSVASLHFSDGLLAAGLVGEGVYLLQNAFKGIDK